MANEPTKSIAERRRWRWQIAPRWLGLARQGNLPWIEWLHSDRVSIVKQGRHRTVYRVDVAEQAFYVKHDHRGGWLRRLWHRWFGATAEREFSRVVELRRRGLPVVEPVACGLAPGSAASDNIFVTVAVNGAQSLNEYAAALPAELNEPLRIERRWLLDAMADLMVAAHRAGVLHNDLHGGNVLVAPTADAENIASQRLQLYLVDVPGIRLTRALRWQQAVINLVMLNHDWRDRTTVRERLHWLRRYLRRSHDQGAVYPGLRKAAAEISARTDDYSCRLMLRRDRRAWHDNRDFHHGSTSSAAWWGVRDVVAADAARLAEQLSAGGEPPASIMLGGRVCEIESISLAAARFERWLPQRWRWSAARRAWQTGQGLWSRGIAAARPLLLVCPRRAAKSAQAWVVYPRQVDVQRLDAYRAALANLPSQERTAAVAELNQAIAQLLNQLQRWRVCLEDASKPLAERGTVPFCSAALANLGQSPAVLNLVLERPTAESLHVWREHGRLRVELAPATAIRFERRPRRSRD